MLPTVSWATVSSCVRRPRGRAICRSSPWLPRFAYPNVPRTDSRPQAGRGYRFSAQSGAPVIQRLVLLSCLALAVGCTGHRRAPTTSPAPDAAGLPPAPADSPTRPSANEALLLPPAPALDTLVPAEELAAELRLA